MSMLRNGVMLTLICVLLCLTFNYTFPLSRESSKWNIFVNNNENRHCDKKIHENVLQSLKQLPAIENTLKIVDKKIKKFKKKNQCHNADEDLNNFAEMVIKKKNPYVDLKELDTKFYNGKNSKQSLDPGPSLVEEPLLCEQENSMNVEIINRGLSGFAFPAKLLKNVGVLAKFNVGTVDNDVRKTMQPEIATKQPTRRNPDAKLLSALEDDIKQFEDSKAVNS